MMKRYIMIGLILTTLCSLAAQSKGKDFLLSLAVPGFSQINSGRNYGYAMLATEATLIGTMFYLSSESQLMRDESYSYALKFAHIEPQDYDSEFLKNLGRYNSSGFEADGFNATVRRTALNLYPEDPVAQQLYIDEHSYGEAEYWRWDSVADRAKYNKLRNDAADLESYGKLAVGVMLFNHLMSGIDVLRYSRDHRTQFSMGMKKGHPQLKVSYRF